MSNKVKVLVGIVVAVVVGLGVAAGTALAQGGGEGGPPADGRCGRFLEGVASHLDVSVEGVDAAFKATKGDMLDEAVEAGKIDPERAAQMRERIEEGSACLHPHPRQHNRGLRPLRGLVIHAAAETLDMAPRELVGELRECKSLAQVAAEQEVGRDDLKSGILGEADERLDEAVASERITQERADQVLQGLTDNIDEILDRVRCPEAPPEA